MIAEENRTPAFLRIYFLDPMEGQVQRRLAYFSDLQRPTVQRLQDTLFASNHLIRELRSARTQAENENIEYHIVIVEDRTPVAEHARRYNRQLSPFYKSANHKIAET